MQFKIKNQSYTTKKKKSRSCNLKNKDQSLAHKN